LPVGYGGVDITDHPRGEIVAHPNWFTDIAWSATVPIEVLREHRSLIPSRPGVYCFTSYPTALEQNLGVLYVGRSKNLRARLPVYLRDPERVMVQSTRSRRSAWNTALAHSGAALMLMEVQAKYRPEAGGRTAIWARWHECENPTPAEERLIEYLQPKYCSVGVAR
jgi:hypothetical protein